MKKVYLKVNPFADLFQNSMDESFILSIYESYTSFAFVEATSNKKENGCYHM